MTTPVEELRAAATKLRETYAALLAHKDIRGALPLEEWGEWFGPTDMVNLPEVNAWIRLMGPALAEPIAAWLEACAEDLETAARVVAKWGDAEQLKYSDYIGEPDSVRHALAVARQINGGARNA